jgi:hypothetical protein
MTLSYTESLLTLLHTIDRHQKFIFDVSCLNTTDIKDHLRGMR